MGFKVKFLHENSANFKRKRNANYIEYLVL